MAAEFWILVAAWALVGASMGSTVNVIVYRLPRMLEAGWRRDAREILRGDAAAGRAAQEDAAEDPPLNLAAPRSHCPQCKAAIPWRLNVPVLSWLVLRGQCRFCGKPIPWRYPVVELLGGAAAGVAFAARYPDIGAAVALAFLLLALLAMAATDADSGLLPDALTLPTLWGGLLAATQGWSGLSATQAVLGAAAGYLVLRGVAEAYLRLRKREGMGGGDWKMFAAIGAWVGWSGLPLVLLVASLVGALVGLASMRAGRAGDSIRFGPALAAGAVVQVFWGRELSALFFLG